MAAGFHFMAHQFALRWAKENLPEEKYQRVAKPHRITFKRTLIFVVVCCIPVLILFLSLIFCAPFPKGKKPMQRPKGQLAMFWHEWITTAIFTGRMIEKI